jgi:primosomal replication protein N
VIEAGGSRRIEMELPLRALGDAARWLEAAEVGSTVEIDGFLAPKSLKSRTPVLHVNTLKFI